MFLMTVVAALFLLLLAGAYTLLRGGNNPPSVGSPAPDFTLSSQDRQPVKLSAFWGQWVVLYFYPKDFTGGSTFVAHNFHLDLAHSLNSFPCLFAFSVL